MAAPFAGEVFTFYNPDETEIHVRGWGNQHYAVFEDLAGFTVVKHPDTGFYHYATLSDDGERLLPTSARVGVDDPADHSLVAGIRIRKQAARDEVVRALAAEPDTRRWVQRRRDKRAAIEAAARALALSEGDETTMAPLSAPTVGNYVGLCLIIDFPDVSPTITRSEVEAFCNQPGYTGFGNNGSVRDYFRDVSDNKLTYTNIVTQYYTASRNRSYYTDESQPFGARARELIEEALDSLVANGFDFSGLTADSGGYIYALNVFYAGPRVNGWSEGLWPHAWALASPYNVGGGKRFNDYQITNMGSQLTLGTFVHENGHLICDFPDLYDYGYESRGVGHFCLMASGGSSKNPVEVGAYLKRAAGWTSSIQPIATGVAGAVTAGQNDFYIHHKSATEYFIIENRQQTGRDASLPDHGLAIWHVDELGSNNNEQMTPSQHYECSLIQADNQFDLESNVNAGDADDLFGAPGATTFSDTTAPNAKWWNGANSGLILADISASGPTMTFGTGDRPPNGDGLAAIYDLLLS